jgi:glucose/arabinose dehydrogenase
MPRRPPLLSLLALGTSIVLLGACSDDSDGGSSSTTQRATSSSTRCTVTTTSPASTTTAPANLAAARVGLQTAASGLDSPVALAWRANDARMYVAEQGGTIRIVDNGEVVGSPVLSVDVSGGNEQGLLGLTFSPDGTKLYVDYTDPDGDTHVDEYTMQGDVADTSTRRELLRVDDPFPNHNGGQVTFGPDRMLYITLGDGGGGGDPLNNGQDLHSLFAKILRIDPRPAADAPYSIPPDNPFAGRADARPETWMWGLRNPWRFSFDRATNDVWIGDVGQNAYEEINFAPAGQAGINWGWNAREGFHEFEGDLPDGARDPILETSHNDGNCSITGGYVYRGRAIPDLVGAYVYGDFCVGQLLAAKQSNGSIAEERNLDQRIESLTTFGEDPDGELYAVSRSGTVFKLVPG